MQRLRFGLILKEKLGLRDSGCAVRVWVEPRVRGKDCPSARAAPCPWGLVNYVCGAYCWRLFSNGSPIVHLRGVRTFSRLHTRPVPEMGTLAACDGRAAFTRPRSNGVPDPYFRDEGGTFAAGRYIGALGLLGPLGDSHAKGCCGC